MSKSMKRRQKIYPHTYFKPNKTSVRVYLDYAASVTANPSSIHEEGVKARKKLENARKIVANVLNARKSEIIFTSGGTESNNLAIQGVVWAYKEYLGVSYVHRKLLGIPHIITTNIEHASVLETYKLLEKRKLAQISIIPVEENGIIDPKKIKKEIKSNTVLVSVMYANNEIGTVQPIKEIAKEIRHYKKTHLTRLRHPLLNKERFPFFHTDAVQAANYLDLNVERLGVDLLSLSGSKIEGATPKDGQAGRVGVLYKKKSALLVNIFGGGNQEMGLRPGTENLPEILKFSSALESAQKIKEKEVRRLIKLRDYFFWEMSKTVFGIKFNGDLKNRLPNNLNVTIPNIPSDLLVIELSARGIMASAKSACKSGDGKASHVIVAIRSQDGLPVKALASAGSLRFSLGRQTTKKDIDYTVQALSEILTKLKKWYN